MDSSDTPSSLQERAFAPPLLERLPVGQPHLPPVSTGPGVGTVFPGTQPRILAVVLPHLLCELATQRLPTGPLHASRHSSSGASSREDGRRRPEPPRAIVWTDLAPADWDSKTELDAVNSAAYRLGVRPRQTIGQAHAIVESLILQGLPRIIVSSALKNIAEVALGFGSPVSFQAPDTVWVDVSGSSHLYESERVLALELSAQIKLLGHSVRMAVAGGPWLAQSFARYSCLENAEALLVDPRQTARLVGELPIISLPIEREAVTWFSRLGLLSIDDLRKLPRSTLASRLEGQVQKSMGIPIVLDLIHGHDAGVLTPHRPEELPKEELFWEDPLDSVEPLLFALKGLASRLSARLEGRGQAAQELLLTIHHDRRIAALTSTVTPEVAPKGTPERNSTAVRSAAMNSAAMNSAAMNSAAINTAAINTAESDASSAEALLDEAGHWTKKLTFQLASPLFHAEDLERVMRLRLQRQSLSAPHIGLSLQATAVAEARYGQVNLSESQSWKSGLSTDPRALTVLVAELAADIGAEAVGVLVAKDSHLLEKSSALAPVRDARPELARSAAAPTAISEGEELDALADRLRLPRLPTRLLDPPVEIHAPIRENELWVIFEQAFIVRHIQFDERVEGVEWWDSERVFRDYFRVWLAKEFGQRGAVIPRGPQPRSVAPRGPQPRSVAPRGPQPRSVAPRGPQPRSPYADVLHDTLERQGLQALVYRDREQGKSYIHAIYD